MPVAQRGGKARSACGMNEVGEGVSSRDLPGKKRGGLKGGCRLSVTARDE